MLPEYLHLKVWVPGTKKNLVAGNPVKVGRDLHNRLACSGPVIPICVSEEWNVQHMVHATLYPVENVVKIKRPDQERPRGLDALVQQLRLLNVTVMEET